MGDQEISKEMTSMHRHECRCKGYIRNSQTRGWRKSVHLEKLTFEEYKNYSGDGVWRGNLRGIETGNEAEEESWTLYKPH